MEGVAFYTLHNPRPLELDDLSLLGSGANSLDGSATIGSGVGTATSSGADSFSTADAGVAEVSGGLTLGTGIATDGDSGAVANSIVGIGHRRGHFSHSRLG